MSRGYASLEQAIADNVGQGDGCWIWRGSISTTGYGIVGSRGRQYSAHRIVYEALVAPIPEGFHIDHLCREPLCVNPDHLEALPPRAHALRGMNPYAISARKIRCSKGHPFDAENTGQRLDHRGRYCKTCRRTWERARRARQRA